MFRLTGQKLRSFEGHCLCQGHANMSSVGGFSVLCSYDWFKLFKLVKLLEEISMMSLIKIDNNWTRSSLQVSYIAVDILYKFLCIEVRIMVMPASFGMMWLYSMCLC